MARVETLLEQYRPILDELDERAKASRTCAVRID
jgi:hypothetical protein